MDFYFSICPPEIFLGGPPKYVVEGTAKLEARGDREMEEARVRLRGKYPFSRYMRRLAGAESGADSVASALRGTKSGSDISGIDAF